MRYSLYIKQMISMYHPISFFVLILTLFNRIMVGLPGVENREKILRTLLTKERVDEGLDFKELATMTEGYTGSDLKVCFSCSSFGLMVLNFELLIWDIIA